MDLKIGFLVLYLSVGLSLSSQINNRWMIGRYPHLGVDTLTPDTLTDEYKFGLNIIQFNDTGFNQARYWGGLDLDRCNVQAYDEKDSLLFYSNGSKIFHRRHRLMENGDSLNYNSSWKYYPPSYNLSYNTGRYPEIMIAIPKPKAPSIYYLLSPILDYDTTIKYAVDFALKFTYTTVDMSQNGGLGKVIEKNKIILNGKFYPTVAACKHANGRDWWIIIRELETGCYQRILLDSLGIHTSSIKTCPNGWILKRDSFHQNLSSRFSPDGKRFASISSKGLEYYDFDRCTGTLSNRKEIPTSAFDSVDNFWHGVCFSPNSQLLYVLFLNRIFQLNLANNSKQIIARYEGLADPIGTEFLGAQIAPNNKIYIATVSPSRTIYVMDSPDNLGSRCSFKRKGGKYLVSLSQNVPHYPNYKLGALIDTCPSSHLQSSLRDALSVYPNPARDYVYVSTSTVIPNSVRNLHLSLYNLLGQKTSTEVEATSQGFRLDIRALPVGMYLLEIKDREEQFIKVERILIQH